MEMRKAVNTEFRKRGLLLRGDSVKLVALYVEDSNRSVETVADLIAEALDKQQLSSSILSVDVIENIVAGLLSGGGSEGPGGGDSIEIIDAFQVPRFSFDTIKRSFYRVKESGSVFGSAKDKVSLYQERLHMLQHRVQHNLFFSKPSLELATSASRDFCQLSTVQALVSSAGNPATQYLLGLLTEVEDGRLHIEDTTGRIQVELGLAAVTAGLFTENCIIIAEGVVSKDQVLHVHCLGFPTLHPRHDFRLSTGGENFFGGRSILAEEWSGLEAKEKEAEAELHVVLSDVYLDRQDTWENLSKVFDGFSQVENPPSLFVLMGNFFGNRSTVDQGHVQEMTECFDALADLICSYESLKERSRFVFIPGPMDPRPSPALPQPPLPVLLTQKLRDNLPNCVFASNPCRIRFLAQELVFFRADLQAPMLRLCRLPPLLSETDGDVFPHLAMTLLQQGHLCPLPLTLQPIYWALDHALRLYSPPHTLVLADSTPQSSFPYADADCNCFNPGSFGTKGTFGAYRPAERVVELCSI